MYSTIAVLTDAWKVSIFLFMMASAVMHQVCSSVYLSPVQRINKKDRIECFRTNFDVLFIEFLFIMCRHMGSACTSTSRSARPQVESLVASRTH
jgi:hypothetical protein